MNSCLCVLQGLPSFRTLTVHLPHLRVDYLEAGGAGAGGPASCGSESYLGGGGGNELGFTHVAQLIQAIQQSAPCAVLLCGAEEWLHDQGLEEEEDEAEAKDDTSTRRCYSSEERAWRVRHMRALRYYLSLLAETEVMLMIPCARPSTWQQLFNCRLDLEEEEEEESEAARSTSENDEDDANEEEEEEKGETKVSSVRRSPTPECQLQQAHATRFPQQMRASGSRERCHAVSPKPPLRSRSVSQSTRTHPHSPHRPVFVSARLHAVRIRVHIHKHYLCVITLIVPKLTRCMAINS